CLPFRMHWARQRGIQGPGLSRNISFLVDALYLQTSRCIFSADVMSWPKMSSARHPPRFSALIWMIHITEFNPLVSAPVLVSGNGLLLYRIMQSPLNYTQPNI